tara:strand:+ start:55 stop:228 length:174 start_codon:yes stop_codon:yes gene_type:complete
VIIGLAFLFVVVLYLWWQIFKLKVLIANIILQEKSKQLYDEYMKDLKFKGGHNTERN